MQSVDIDRNACRDRLGIRSQLWESHFGAVKALPLGVPQADDMSGDLPLAGNASLPPPRSKGLLERYDRQDGVDVWREA